MDETTIWMIMVAIGTFLAATKWQPSKKYEDAKGWIIAGVATVSLFGVPWAISELNEEKCSQWWDLVAADAATIQSETVDFDRALYLARLNWEDQAPLWCP